MQSLQPAKGCESERKEQETLLLLALFIRVRREECWAPHGKSYESQQHSLQPVGCILQTNCINMHKSFGNCGDLFHNQTQHAVQDWPVHLSAVSA